MDVNSLLKLGVESKASDIHVGVEISPMLRVDARLIPSDIPAVTQETIFRWIEELSGDESLAHFRKQRELDFSHIHQEYGSFRVNAFFERGQPAMAIRILPGEIWGFEQCGLPASQMKQFASTPTGLILVTGSTGSGKTTTLASLIDHINQTRECHIVTVEDPIEYVHKNKRSKVDQREVGRDTHSFSGALKYILRQDPDVVLVGEMRDVETIETALMVAETGHLVLATLHTSDAVQTVNRVIDVFSDQKQQQIRVTLSFVLSAVISQKLIPGTDHGRQLASEVLIANPAVKALIRESKLHQLYSMIQTGSNSGMRTMNQSLCELVSAGKITREQAMLNSPDPEELKGLI